MTIELTSDGISSYLKGMLSRANLVQGWLNRVAYPRLIKIQRERWQSEGANEGTKWTPLKSDRYKRYKLTKFADYPGGGRHLLVATSRLVDSMTGDNQNDHWKLVTNRSLEVGSLVPYAPYVNDARNIVVLSDETIEELETELELYLKGS